MQELFQTKKYAVKSLKQCWYKPFSCP